MNREAIAVDQDSLGKGGHRVAEATGSETWVKPLTRGDYAIALFNRSEESRKLSVKWSDLDLTGEYTVRDLWKHADLGAQRLGIDGLVPAHGTMLVRITQQKPGAPN